MRFHRAALSLGIALGVASAAEAHVEYYDLNQGKQVADLTAQGKTASTTQYGSNPTVAGLPSLNTASDRPLNNTAQWNSTYQSTTTVGTFTGISYTNSHSAATVTVGDVTDFGWGDGTRGTLGDSHKVDFFNFRLAVKSTVSISWTVDDREGAYLDSAFSLYGGVLAYQAHDGSLDPLNPTTGLPPRKIQDPLDTGTVADAQGIASAFRNTAPGAPTYVGQFNAVANWGQSNGAGNWSNIAFLQAVNAKHNADGFSAAQSAMLESLVIELLPGNYTIAASGALGAVGYGANPGSFGLTNLRGVLTFSADAVAVPPPPPAPVPLPASHLLLAGAALWLARQRSCAGRRST